MVIIIHGFLVDFAPAWAELLVPSLFNELYVSIKDVFSPLFDNAGASWLRASLGFSCRDDRF